MDMNIERALATSALREFSSIEKAVHLVQNLKFSFRRVAKQCGVSVAAIQRGILASKSNRAIGENGRPRVFNYEEEAAVLSWTNEGGQRVEGGTMVETQQIVRVIHADISTKSSIMIKIINSNRCVKYI